MLRFLDKFERNPEIYTRSEVKIETQNGTILNAWIFVFHSYREELLSLELYEKYICNNYDVLSSVSGGKLAPEERLQLLASLRM